MTKRQEIRTYKESIENWDITNEMYEEIKLLFSTGSAKKVNDYMKQEGMMQSFETVESLDEKGFPFLTIKQTYNYS